MNPRTGLRLACLCLAIAIASTCAAQAQSRYFIGAQLGIVSATGTLEPDPPYSVTISSRTGLCIGGFAGMEIWPMLSVQAGVRYTQRGAEVSGVGLKSDISFDYVEIPVTIRVNLLTGGLRPFIFAGPSLGFLSSAESETTFLGMASTTDQSKYAESTNITMDFGAGAELRISSTMGVMAGLGYSLGLSNVNKGYPDITKTTIAKHSSLNLFAGVTFGL